jgi:hypothetical protein
MKHPVALLHPPPVLRDSNNPINQRTTAREGLVRIAEICGPCFGQVDWPSVAERPPKASPNGAESITSPALTPRNPVQEFRISLCPIRRCEHAGVLIG